MKNEHLSGSEVAHSSWILHSAEAYLRAPYRLIWRFLSFFFWRRFTAQKSHAMMFPKFYSGRLILLHAPIDSKHAAK